MKGLMNPVILERLRAADDPVEYEAPTNFNWRTAVDKVRNFKQKLQAHIERDLTLDDQVQDASFFADLAIYRQSAKLGVIESALIVRFSTFGNLVTVYDVRSEEAPAETVTRVIELVEQEGFSYVDRASLEEPYSGVHPYFAGYTWWYRFFEYN
jgi:hypothetical protein